MQSVLKILMNLALFSFWLSSCAQQNSQASSAKASAMNQEKASAEANQLNEGSVNQSDAIEVSKSKGEQLARGDVNIDGPAASPEETPVSCAPVTLPIEIDGGAVKENGSAGFQVFIERLKALPLTVKISCFETEERLIPCTLPPYMIYYGSEEPVKLKEGDDYRASAADPFTSVVLDQFLNSGLEFSLLQIVFSSDPSSGLPNTPGLGGSSIPFCHLP